MLFAPSVSRFPRLEPLPRESFESLLSRPQGTERQAFLSDAPPIRPSASNSLNRSGTMREGLCSPVSWKDPESGR